MVIRLHPEDVDRDLAALVSLLNLIAGNLGSGRDGDGLKAHRPGVYGGHTRPALEPNGGPRSRAEITKIRIHRLNISQGRVLESSLNFVR